ncbi:MAG: hypothetical protein GY760_14255 [Deltaproteobacteria bacterium]|nr:hypothetical protein [Deltaproteobacteria bacterium]
MLSQFQKDILKSDDILVNWLFKITDQDGLYYYFSNREIAKYEGTRNVGHSFIGVSYTERERIFENQVLNFNGITLRRNSSEMNMQTPDDLEFELDNSNDVLSATGPEGSIFAGGTVLLTLQLNNTDFYSWRFRIIRADFSQEKTIRIKCKDFLQEMCDQTYPSMLISDLFGQAACRGNESATVPVFIGKGYLPLTPVFFSETETLYLLGPAEFNYTIHKARSPRSFGEKFEFEYFGQITKTGNDGKEYKFVYATVEVGASAFHNALWENGDRLHEMPFQVSRSDTENYTNPADWIEFVLKDMGIPETDIDDFDEIKSIFTNRGLEWNGGYNCKRYIKDIIPELQKSCHSQFICGEKIRLETLTNTVLGDINKTKVFLTGDIFSLDSFNAESQEYAETADSGYVAFAEQNEPPDTLLKTLVSADTGTTNPSSSILDLPFITNSIHAQKLGKLNFQLLLNKVSENNFSGQPECLEYLPNSNIQINENDYGGTYEILVEEMSISDSLEIQMQCIRFSKALDDWDSLEFVEVTPTDISNANAYRVPVVGGSVEYDPTKNVLNNINYTMYNNELIQTNENHVENGGIRIDKTGISIYSADGEKLFEADIAAGTVFVK